MALFLGGVIKIPSTTANTLLAAPSVTYPSRTKIASAQLFSTACWRNRILPNNAIAFILHKLHRLSSTLTALTPTFFASNGRISLHIIKTLGLTPIGNA